MGWSRVQRPALSSTGKDSTFHVRLGWGKEGRHPRRCGDSAHMMKPVWASLSPVMMRVETTTLAAALYTSRVFCGSGIVLGLVRFPSKPSCEVVTITIPSLQVKKLRQRLVRPTLLVNGGGRQDSAQLLWLLAPALDLIQVGSARRCMARVDAGLGHGEGWNHHEIF